MNCTEFVSLLGWYGHLSILAVPVHESLMTSMPVSDKLQSTNSLNKRMFPSYTSRMPEPSRRAVVASWGQSPAPPVFLLCHSPQLRLVLSDGSVNSNTLSGKRQRNSSGKRQRKRSAPHSKTLLSSSWTHSLTSMAELIHVAMSGHEGSGRWAFCSRHPCSPITCRASMTKEEGNGQWRALAISATHASF